MDLPVRPTVVNDTVAAAPLSPRGQPTFGRLRRYLNSSLRVRIYVLIAVGAAISITAIWLADNGGDEAARNLAERGLQAETSAAAYGVAARIAEVQASLRVADLIVGQGGSMAGLCQALSAGTQPAYQRAFVLSPSGNLQCSTVPGIRDAPEAFRTASYFQAALATGRDQVGGPFIGPYTGRLSLGFAHSLGGTTPPTGVVVAGVDAADVLHQVEPVSGGDRLFAVGRDGDRLELGRAEPPAFPAEVEQSVARALATGEACPALTVSGTVWTCSRAGDHALVVVAAHSERRVFAAAFDATKHQWYRAAGIGMVAVLAAFVNDFLFLRRIRGAHQSAGLAELKADQTTRRDEIDALREWAETSGGALQRLQGEVDSHEGRRLATERGVLALMAEAVELRYPFMRDHGDRVGRYARQVGVGLGLAEGDLELLEFAARVHDVGMISVPDAVLLKPAAFEPIEAAQMQLHAPRGGETLRRLSGIPHSVVAAVQHHHERWDGAGYPDGLAGTEIPLWSRIIAVADAYDAMTEARPHRPHARTHDEAIDVLRRGAGAQWDTVVVDAFIDAIASHREHMRWGVGAG